MNSSLLERGGEKDMEGMVTKVLRELVRPHKLGYELPGSPFREINVPSRNID